MQDPLDYLSSSDLDKMYFDKETKKPDRTEFLNEVIREVNIHCQLNHWKLLPRKEVSKGQPILDYVWEMNIKYDIVTRQVYKCKAILNVHGEQQDYRVNYLETYSSVVTWLSIRTLLTLAIIN